MAGYADWNAFTTYNINDIVNYQGFLYVALQISLNRVPPANTTFWSSTTPSGGVASLNAQTGPVLLTSSTITITNPVPGTVNIESGALPTVVDSLNSQTGTVSLTSSGSTVVITNPAPGQINLESITDGVQSITAGTGISSTGGTTPTIANTGVLSVAAGSGVSSTGGQNPTIANTGVLSVAVSSGLSSTGGQNPTLTNTGVLGINSQTGSVSLTSTGGTIAITPAGGNVNLETVGAPIAPSIVFTDTLVMSSAGGIAASPTAYTAPATGVYQFIFRTFIANSSTGAGPFTTVSWNPSLTGGTLGTTVGEGFTVSILRSGLNIVNCSSCGSRTVGNLFYGSTQYTFTDTLSLTAGNVVRLQTQVQNNGSLSWGYAATTLNIIRLS